MGRTSRTLVSDSFLVRPSRLLELTTPESECRRKFRILFSARRRQQPTKKKTKRFRTAREQSEYERFGHAIVGEKLHKHQHMISKDSNALFFGDCNEVFHLRRVSLFSRSPDVVFCRQKPHAARRVYTIAKGRLWWCAKAAVGPDAREKMLALSRASSSSTISQKQKKTRLDSRLWISRGVKSLFVRAPWSSRSTSEEEIKSCLWLEKLSGKLILSSSVCLKCKFFHCAKARVTIARAGIFC